MNNPTGESHSFQRADSDELAESSMEALSQDLWNSYCYDATFVDFFIPASDEVQKPTDRKDLENLVNSVCLKTRIGDSDDKYYYLLQREKNERQQLEVTFLNGQSDDKGYDIAILTIRQFLPEGAWLIHDYRLSIFRSTPQIAKQTTIHNSLSNPRQHPSNNFNQQHEQIVSGINLDAWKHQLAIDDIDSFEIKSLINLIKDSEVVFSSNDIDC